MTADALAPPRDRRPLALTLAANTVSITGNALTLIGVPWFVLQTTGSATRAGVVALCATLPVIVSALFGGPLIDRIGRRRASILSDLVCVAAVGAVPLLLAMCAMVMVTNGLDHGWSAVLLPSHAATHLGGAAQLGLLSALWGAGALTGTFLYAAFGHRLPRWPVFAVCFLLIGAPRFATAAFTDTALPLAVLLPLTGLGAGALNPILSTVTFEIVPERLRTRVLGATTAAVLLTTPLGGLFAGLLTDHLGLRTAFLVVGTGYFLATLSPLVFPVWRTMDRTGLPAPATAGRKPVDTPAPARSDGAP